MTQKPALLCAMAALFSPLGAHALGLGDIRLNSALNEPLDAEIELISATPDELRNLSAKIAGRDTFGRYGLDYPEFLSGLNFTVTRDESGANVLRVTTRRPVPEPFVTFLVEADWESGRLLREYTVLLDPPVFMPSEQAPAPVAAPSTAAPPAATSGTISRPTPVARPEPGPAPVAQPTYTAPASAAGPSEYGPVQRNQTLSEIALAVRPDRGISINQMMIAIYNANPDAFRGNINVLKRGAVLSIPSAAQIRGLSNGEAVAEVRQHNQSWRSGQAPATATAAASSAPAAADQSSRLRLVAPDSGADTAPAAGSGGAADQAALVASRERLADAQAQANALRDELDVAQDELAEARRLLSLRDAEMAQLQASLAERDAQADEQADGQAVEAEAADTAPGVSLTSDATAEQEPATDVDSQPPAQEPAAEPAAVAETVTAPPAEEPKSEGLLATVGNIVSGLGVWLWAILLGLIALGVAAVMALRGRGASSDDWEAELTAAAQATDADADATRIRPDVTEAPAAPVPASTPDETSTFKPVDFTGSEAEEATISEAPSETAEYPFEDTMASDEAMKLDQSDPLAEADFHMAYGLYDQAADLVRKASEREPDRRDLQHKLLEIYFVWGNKASFLDGARKLREAMGPAPDAEWDKIVIMGKQICPEDALFSGDAGATVAASAIDLDLMSGGQGTDFDLGDDDETASASAEMDLDLGEALSGGMAVGGTEIQPAPSAGASQSADVIDFDFGMDSDAGNEDTESALDPVAAVREKVESGLLSSEETAEMDLESIGVDLDSADTGVQDFIETTETRVAGSVEKTAEAQELDVDELLGDFDDFTSLTDDGEDVDLEATQQRMAPDFSKEQGLDVDLDLGLGDEPVQGEDETEGELVTLESIAAAADDDDESHFSAEIETLSGDSIDMDFGDLAASTDNIGPNDETVLADIPQFRDQDEGEDFADVFGAEDETALMETASTVETETADDASTQIFGPDDVTQEMSEVDLDVGDMVEDQDAGPTTLKVPAAELALPEADDEGGAVNEIGTKLDLARAYMDMGDPDGARGILEEVLDEGDETQQQDARELLANLG